MKIIPTDARESWKYSTRSRSTLQITLRITLFHCVIDTVSTYFLVLQHHAFICSIRHSNLFLLWVYWPKRWFHLLSRKVSGSPQDIPSFHSPDQVSLLSSQPPAKEPASASLTCAAANLFVFIFVFIVDDGSVEGHMNCSKRGLLLTITSLYTSLCFGWHFSRPKLWYK